MITTISLMATLILTILSSRNNHPLVLTLIIVILSLAIIPVVSAYSSSWISISMMLVFLGGIIVVFIFVTSLAGNIKIRANSSQLALAVLFVFAGFTLSFANFIPSPNLPEPSPVSISFSHPNAATIMFLTVFLLLTLFAAINTVQCFNGALNNTN